MEKSFFNIFPKKREIKKIEQKGNPKVIADYRERNCLVASELIYHGLEVEFKELKVADYIVKDIAIERKTVSDFISSMVNKRLINQLQDLKQYENRLLIIEGIDEQDLYSEKYAEERRKMHPNSVRGFLLSILLKHKVPIIFTKDYRDTAKFILILSKKKNKEMSLNASKKTLNKKDRMQYILEGFPGIGPKTAKKLLNYFKTIKNIINASEEELKKILGKKAEIIKRLIEEDY